MTSLLGQGLGGGASLELLGLMASGTNAITGLVPGLPLAGLYSPLGAWLLQLVNCPKRLYPGLYDGVTENLGFGVKDLDLNSCSATN